MTGIEGVAAGIGRATHAHKKGAVNKPAVMELSAHRFFIFQLPKRTARRWKAPWWNRAPRFRTVEWRIILRALPVACFATDPVSADCRQQQADRSTGDFSFRFVKP